MIRTTGRTVLAAAVGALALLGVAAGPTAAATPSPTVAAAAADGHAPHRDRPAPLPRIAVRWAEAWNSGDSRRLAALFTADARYTDHAFGATFTGREGVAEWARISGASITGLTVRIEDAFRAGRGVAIRWTFSGTIVGAPRPFAVPAATLLELRGGRIVTDDDYYNLAEVLRQSGLPADLDLTAPPAP